MSAAHPQQQAHPTSQGLSRWLLHEAPPIAGLARWKNYSWLVVATVCIGAFMGQLDASIVSLVLPTLEDTFHTHVNHAQWVAIVYLLVLAALLIPLGRVADSLGRKALYTLGFIVFSAASAACGLANGLGFLIAARAVQGAGAALLQANSVAIIPAATPRDRLGRAIGLQGVAQALGLAIGPTVGGFLIAWIDWRWVFLINLPIGVVGAAMAILVLPQSREQHTAISFNWIGAAILPLTIAALLLSLTFMHLAIVFGPLALLGVLAFAWSEHNAAEPLIGMSLLRAPGLAAGMVAGLLGYTALFGALFAMPVLLERVFGDGPERAGLILTVVPASLAAVSLLGGVLNDRLGPRLPTVIGMLLVSTGLVLLWWAVDHHLIWLLAGLGLVGLGSGLFIPANNASVMGSAPTTRLGVAGGVLNLVRGLGTSFGVAVVGLVLVVHTGTISSQVVMAPILLSAIRDIIIVLIVAAIGAGVLSFFRRESLDLGIRDYGDIM